MLLLASCNGHHETVTGGYGQNVIAGQATMAAGSVAGVQVSVAGTGMTATLRDDGRFAFTGVPDNAELLFARASDDVRASIRVPSSATNLHIELAPNAARSGRSRAVAPLPPLLQFEGTVSSVSAMSIVVSDSHKQDVTIAIDAKTVIRRGDQSLTASDLAAGDRVHVKASVSNDVKTAVEITVQGGEDQGEHGDHGGQTMTANGTVTAVGSGQLIVSTEAHGDVVVKVDAQTIIKKQGQPIALTDIHSGDGVNTLGTRIDDHTEKAQQIEVRGSSGNPHH
jgi:hypothetical protein